MARKRVIDPDKVRFGLTIRPSLYSDGYYFLLVPMNAKDTNLDNWIQALKDKWPEILKFQEERYLLSGPSEKPKFIRRHTLLKWKVFNRDNFTCKTCGKREDLEIDHIRPVTKGGKDNIENLQTLCKRCNVKKGNKYVKT